MKGSITDKGKVAFIRDLGTLQLVGLCRFIIEIPGAGRERCAYLRFAWSIIEN